jgi:hypothetical protein
VGYFADRVPLSVLVFEIIMACASSREGVARSICVTSSTVYVERGHAVLGDDFDVGRSYLAQGKPWGPERTTKKRSQLRRLWDRVAAWAARPPEG